MVQRFAADSFFNAASVTILKLSHFSNARGPKASSVPDRHEGLCFYRSETLKMNDLLLAPGFQSSLKSWFLDYMIYNRMGG
jgi:hypothetical protein